MTSSSGDRGQSGNPTSSMPVIKKDFDLARRFFYQKCGGDGHHAGIALNPYGVRSIVRKHMSQLDVFFQNRANPVCPLLACQWMD